MVRRQIMLLKLGDGQSDIVAQRHQLIVSVRTPAGAIGSGARQRCDRGEQSAERRAQSAESKEQGAQAACAVPHLSCSAAFVASTSAFAASRSWRTNESFSSAAICSRMEPAFAMFSACTADCSSSRSECCAACSDSPAWIWHSAVAGAEPRAGGECLQQHETRRCHRCRPRVAGRGGRLAGGWAVAAVAGASTRICTPLVRTHNAPGML